MNENDVRKEWEQRSGAYSPEYYAHYGPDETSDLVLELVDQYVDGDAAVLELGCSCGRHLAHLREHGFADVTGIEINEDAADVMRETYPDLAADGTFHFEPIEDVIGDFDDDAFDVVFSVETLQHIHPDAAWVFDDLARIAGDLLLTAEIEDGYGRDSPDEEVNFVHGEFPLYYRDWTEVFEPRGFEQAAVETTERDTIRAFRAERSD